MDWLHCSCQDKGWHMFEARKSDIDWHSNHKTSDLSTIDNPKIFLFITVTMEKGKLMIWSNESNAPGHLLTTSEEFRFQLFQFVSFYRFTSRVSVRMRNPYVWCVLHTMNTYPDNSQDKGTRTRQFSAYLGLNNDTFLSIPHIRVHFLFSSSSSDKASLFTVMGVYWTRQERRPRVVADIVATQIHYPVGWL